MGAQREPRPGVQAARQQGQRGAGASVYIPAPSPRKEDQCGTLSADTDEIGFRCATISLGRK